MFMTVCQRKHSFTWMDVPSEHWTTTKLQALSNKGGYFFNNKKKDISVKDLTAE